MAPNTPPPKKKKTHGPGWCLPQQWGSGVQGQSPCTFPGLVLNRQNKGYQGDPNQQGSTPPQPCGLVTS